jgi:hypothetical protein
MTTIDVTNITKDDALHALNIVKALVLRRTENLPTERVKHDTLLVLTAVEAWLKDSTDTVVTVALAHTTNE